MVRDCVKGTSKVFGVIGDPISHSFSPIIHNTIAEKLGHDIVYNAFHVTSQGLEDAIKGAFALGIKGINVTIPHKQEVIKHIFKIHPSAEYAGAVNTLSYTENGYVGYNTDIIGIKKTFENNGISLLGKDVVIFGAGGSGIAALYAVLDGGANNIYIVNRSLQNANVIAEKAKKYYNKNIIVLSQDVVCSIPKVDIAIQATPLGFSRNEHKSPVADTKFFEKPQIFFDCIYTPWETVFLKEGAKLGKTCINGFDMLIYQAVAAYEIWMGMELSTDFVTNIKSELSAYYRQVPFEKQ